MPDQDMAATVASTETWSCNTATEITTVSGLADFMFWRSFAAGWVPRVSGRTRCEAVYDAEDGGSASTTTFARCGPTERLELAIALRDPPAQDPASLRARALLREALARWQQNDFNATRSFRVVGASGRTYRIDPMRHRNVKVLGKAGIEWVLCASPADEELPVEDVMLAQKLLLETDELEFLRRSNVMHPYDLSRAVKPNPLLKEPFREATTQ